MSLCMCYIYITHAILRLPGVEGHCLTTRHDVELRIDTVDTIYSGTERWAVYQTFSVSGSDETYQLNIGEGEGSAGYEGLISAHSGHSFSTTDSDTQVIMALPWQRASIQLMGYC